MTRNNVVNIDGSIDWDKIGGFESQLAENTNHLKTKEVNAKYPKPPLVGAKGDGVTDDSSAINALINHCKTNKLKLFFPSSTYYCANSLNMDSNVSIEGSGNDTIFKFGAGVHGFVGNGDIYFLTLKNFQINGTATPNSLENGINLVGGASGLPRLIIDSVKVSGMGNCGMYIEHCWDSRIRNINVSGNQGHGAWFVESNGADINIVAFGNKEKGVLVQNAANLRLTGTAQENSKEGVRLESVTASTINIYCEQNGWEGTTNEEQSELVLSLLALHGDSFGNVINMFGLGGKGTAMTSNYGIYSNYASNNEINGLFGGYGVSDLYFTSQSKNNRINAVSHMSGLPNGDTPTKVTNNGTMNGYAIVGTQGNSRIESLSYASQSTARTITFAKPFTVAPRVVGTVVISTSTAALTCKINNITTTGFEFVVADGTQLVPAVQCNFVAIGQ